ncbi:MAG: TolC family protein [Thermoguttaceae bacterium]
MILIGLWVLLVGCNRAYYRRQADQEVAQAIQSASADPRFALIDYTIEPDPASRMYDPFDPDCPPMPPDDPESHKLMHCVDGKRGWTGWDRYGATPFVENFNWRQYLPLDATGALVLDRQGAVETALLHSREFQRNLEELYLSALTVTFERFRFDTQFFGGTGLDFTADGPLRGPGNSQTLLRNDNTLRAERLLATGAELIVGLANSLVWQFSGSDQYAAQTLLSFSLVQPLLRAGGRAVVLERLTDAERAMLANIRQMEQYRRGFYLEIVCGRSAGQGPSRGGLGIPVPPSPSGAAGGFLALLEEQIRIRNQRSNLTGLRESLAQLELAFEAGRLNDRFEVDLTRQALYETQSRLVELESNYKDRLDAYKITLGLPPSLEVRIADPLLARFDLISLDMQQTQDAVLALLSALRDRPQPMPPDCPARLASIRQAILSQLDALPEDFQRLEEALPYRRKNLEALANREEILSGTMDPEPYKVEALNRRVLGDAQTPGLREEFHALVQKRIRPHLAELERLAEALQQAPNTQAAKDTLRESLIDLLAELSNDLSELSLIQARTRLDTIWLVPIDLSPEEALRIARDNRPDWMNCRAALVDSWRQVELAANALRSDLNFTFSGDINTTDNNPVRFRGSTGRLRVGLEFDAPLTRLAERNAYRAAQIAYQQARRNYYAFEDRVDQILRSSLRDIRLTQLDFELRREAVFLAVKQVDLTRRRVAAPPRIGQKEGLGPNTGRNLVQALQQLLSAQNSLLSAWVDSEIQRMNLDFDLGTMQLDDNGMWIDPGPIDAGFLRRVESPEPGGPGKDWQAGPPRAAE